MATGTNIVAVKRHLIGVLPGRLGIIGDYSHVGQHEAADREYLYLGEKASGPMTASTLGGDGRFVRNEQLQFTLTIQVRKLGEQTTEAVEARAVELGTLIEEYLAGNWDAAGDIANLVDLAISEFELQSSNDDDGTSAQLTYTIQLESDVR